MTTKATTNRSLALNGDLNLVKRDAWKLIGIGTVFALLTVLAIIYLAPMLYMVTTSFKSQEQMNEPDKPLLPITYSTFEYQGQALPLYDVTQDGQTRRLALLQELNRSKKIIMIDPQDSAATPITINDRLLTLQQTG